MDNDLIILITEAAISLGTSLALILLLQAVLSALLRSLCHGPIPAAFWSTFTRLMLIISPLLMVLLFSHSLSPTLIPLAQVIRDTLLHALLGHFIGLLIIGKIMLNFSRREHATVAALPMQPETEGAQ
jgi:hypothetical protein